MVVGSSGIERMSYRWLVIVKKVTLSIRVIYVPVQGYIISFFSAFDPRGLKLSGLTSGLTVVLGPGVEVQARGWLVLVPLLKTYQDSCMKPIPITVTLYTWNYHSLVAT